MESLADERSIPATDCPDSDAIKIPRMSPLRALQSVMTENDLLARSMHPRITDEAGPATWELVHALRFRGWLLDNLGVAIPPAVAPLLDSIDGAYCSPRLSRAGLALEPLLALGAYMGGLTDSQITVPWTTRRDYFKPNHRDLTDCVFFMASHDAYHLGRAAARL